MRLIWIRHGETLWNREFRLQGTSDVDLSDRGFLQSRQLAASFRDKADKIYSSPLSRTRDFAAALADRFDLKPVVLDELREMSFGLWEGQRYEDMTPSMQKLFEEWCLDPVNVRPPQGESAAGTVGRVKTAVGKITASLQTGETAAIITHGGVIRIAVPMLMEFPLVTAARLQIDTASVTVMEYLAGHWRLVRLNDTCHLIRNEDCGS